MKDLSFIREHNRWRNNGDDPSGFKLEGILMIMFAAKCQILSGGWPRNSQQNRWLGTGISNWWCGRWTVATVFRRHCSRMSQENSPRFRLLQDIVWDSYRFCSFAQFETYSIWSLWYLYWLVLYKICQEIL